MTTEQVLPSKPFTHVISDKKSGRDFKVRMDVDKSADRPPLLIFKTSAMVIALILGQLLPVAYLIYKNLKAVGDAKQAKIVILSSILIYIILLAIKVTLPFDTIIMIKGIDIDSGIVYYLCEFIMTLALVVSYRTNNLIKDITTGYVYFSNWRALLAVIIVKGLVLIFSFIVYFIIITIVVK